MSESVVKGPDEIRRELADLKNYLDRITAASDALSGGFAVKVVGVK